MQFEIVGSLGNDWTDAPRRVTADEAAKIMAAGRLADIKLHRQMTNSTLPAAVSAVDAIPATI